MRGIHQVRAAVRVLRVLDRRPHSIEVARNAYRMVSTSGEHSATELVLGEDLLVDLGLLTRTSTMLRPSATELGVEALADSEIVSLLAGIVDREKRAETPSVAPLPSFLRELGAAGEERVVAECRAQLFSHGTPRLAEEVERVSLVSDVFGYDVRAPRLRSAARLLEVKTQLGRPVGTVRFHLTRNEYDVGRDDESWYLVVCAAASADLALVEICGWCPAETLIPYLPMDGNGRWSEAVVVLPCRALRPSIPPA